MPAVSFLDPGLHTMNRPRSCRVFVALLSLAVQGCGGEGPGDSPRAADLPSGLPLASPADVGMSAEALERIRPAMQAYVDDGRVPGVMTLVARNGRIVHWDAVGMRVLEDGDPLERDDVFRIYSMTKPVTSVAIMMLVEEGRLGLEHPVADYIPEFADVRVLNDAGERVPADTPVTIEHLLTHTSGLTYGFFGDTPVDSLYRASGVFQGAEGLEDFVARVMELPLLAQPGDRWNYGVSTDVLGRVVEVVSGQPFDAFVEERILEPLAMEDTGFQVPGGDRGRFVANYARTPDGLRLLDSPTDGEYTRAPTWLSGGGGLVSTASDYVRFAQMLLQGGELDGVRILQEETVTAMGTNQLPEAMVPIDAVGYLSPGYGFGLGFAVLVDAGATPEPDVNGIIRWAGAANTFFWIDPANELIGMAWTQFNPFAIEPLEREFQTLVYGALE